MLLAREKTTVLRAVERLVGLQAQLARPPFIGLWSRLQRFRQTWRVERARSSAALVLDPFLALSRKTRGELIEEGKALVRFVESDAQTTEARFA